MKRIVAFGGSSSKILATDAPGTRPEIPRVGQQWSRPSLGASRDANLAYSLRMSLR